MVCLVGEFRIFCVKAFYSDSSLLWSLGAAWWQKIDLLAVYIT